MPEKALQEIPRKVPIRKQWIISIFISLLFLGISVFVIVKTQDYVEDD